MVYQAKRKMEELHSVGLEKSEGGTSHNRLETDAVSNVWDTSSQAVVSLSRDEALLGVSAKGQRSIYAEAPENGMRSRSVF